MQDVVAVGSGFAGTVNSLSLACHITWKEVLSKLQELFRGQRRRPILSTTRNNRQCHLRTGS